MPYVDLFSQSLLFAAYLAVFALLSYAFSLLRAQPHYHRNRKTYGWILSCAIVLALGAWEVIKRGISEDTLPSDGVLWILPLFLALGLLVAGIKHVRLAGVSIAAVFTSSLLLGLIVNNFYHYYPTLSALLAPDQAVATTFSEVPTRTAAKTDIPLLEQSFKTPKNLPTKGQLVPLNIPSSSTNFSPRQGMIYLPPALHSYSTLKLPVIVLLAGHPGNPLHWVQGGLQQIMDAFAARHKGLAPIVAVVDYNGVHDPDTECVDSSLGNSETYLTKDVPEYLKHFYPVQTDPSAWAIGGYSAGGTCAPLVVLRNPNIYQNFLNISGDAMPSIGTPKHTLAVLFNGSQQQMDAHMPDLLLQKNNPLYTKINGWYFYGRQDNASTVHRLQVQYDLAKKAGADVAISSMDGQHSSYVWMKGFELGLPWISYQMKLTTYESQ